MANIFELLFKPKEADSPDKLGLYPERNHVPALPERRYLFTSRYLVVISVINVCITIMLSSILFYILPQRRIVPKLLAIDHRFDIVSLIEPDERLVDSLVLATETYIAEYIYWRHSIVPNVNEMNRRWGPASLVFWYSNLKLYQEFEHTFMPKDLAMAQEDEITREVEIRMISRRYYGIWRAEFLTHDTSPNFKGTRTTIWRALINVAFIKRPYPNQDEAMKNPLDFTVMSYSLSSLGSPDDTKTEAEKAAEAEAEEEAAEEDEYSEEDTETEDSYNSEEEDTYNNTTEEEEPLPEEPPAPPQNISEDGKRMLFKSNPAKVERR
ncbi:MAG: VirB8/TrbF family protein [Alphaproteobacteria bacterium]